MTIASYYEMQTPDGKDLLKAVSQAAASLPHCREYIKCIGDFVTRFGIHEHLCCIRKTGCSQNTCASFVKSHHRL